MTAHGATIRPCTKLNAVNTSCQKRVCFRSFDNADTDMIAMQAKMSLCAASLYQLMDLNASIESASITKNSRHHLMGRMSYLPKSTGISNRFSWARSTTKICPLQKILLFRHPKYSGFMSTAMIGAMTAGTCVAY